MTLMSLRSRQGAGLVEMLIAIIVVSIVLASMVGVLIQQQRFYMVTGDAANAVNVLTRLETQVKPDLLPLSSSANDVVYADADSLTLRAFRGVYAVCEKTLGLNALLTLRSLANARPVPADSGLVYSQGTRGTITDDYWQPVDVVSVVAGTCPDGTAGWVAAVNGLGAVYGEIPLGAPVRVFKRASYWLAAEDGDWLLKTDALGGGVTTVGGPLAPASEAAGSVLRFRYYDKAGNETTTLAQIARIDLETRVEGVVPTTRGGDPLNKDRTISVKLRNATGS